MLKELSLFVYGSLSEGMVHFNKISQYIVAKEQATVAGLVFRLPSGYPVFTNSISANNEHPDRVPGAIVHLAAPEVAFHILDEFHGVSLLAPEKSLFFKETTFAETIDGEKKECFIYSMNRAKLPKGAQRIEAGDWLNNFTNQPALPTTLTERQATYIRKLSQSSGRDIVPIDITLYRELMKLDLIVDKGRRLALSKLGLEVARYLP